MLRLMTTWRLKHVHGVKARSSLGPEHLVGNVLERNAHASNMPASQRYLHEGTRNGSDRGEAPTTDKAVQLRIGGAQMLTSSAHRIYNHNEAHPLFFSQTSPKQAGLCATLVDVLRRLQIRRLTELQGALIPLLLKGKHVVAHAETGTGKSFGVALATANRILRETLNHRLHTIIIVPTEELALQYDKWLKHFGGCASQVSQPAVDSIPLESQLAKLHNIQPNVLVGTVQRIADIANAAPAIIGEKLRRRVDCVILDEADVILSQPVTLNRRRLTGADLVDRIYRQQQDEVPAQMVAISATIDGATAQRLNGWMRNDKAVRITTSFVEHSIPPTLTFYFFASSALAEGSVGTALGRRTAAPPAISPSSGVVGCGAVAGRYTLQHTLELVLRLILRQFKTWSHIPVERPRILLFTHLPTEEMVALLASMQDRVMAEWGPGAAADGSDARKHNSHGCSFVGALHEPADPLNPNRHIQARDLVGRNKEIYVKNNSNMSRLSEGSLLIGVGPYELSRGMHVGGVTHVVMYGEMPSASNFVHCAGRTGRMGKSGDVICVFPPSQGRQLQTVCNAVEIPYQLNKIAYVDSLLKVEGFMAAPDADPPPENDLAPQCNGESAPLHVVPADMHLQEQQRQASVDEEQRALCFQESIEDPYARIRMLDQALFFDDGIDVVQ